MLAKVGSAQSRVKGEVDLVWTHIFERHDSALTPSQHLARSQGQPCLLPINTPHRLRALHHLEVIGR